MELSERLEVTRIHSVSQPMRRRTGLVEHRPFRAPHATASKAALVGGGNPPHAGEVTLAHCGVLFLDEVLEFSRPTLESLRAPLEDRTVVVSRVGCRTQFPASFALLCAMNPCPCGYHGDEQRSCRCTRNQIQAYRDRLSGPLLDRIDLQVRMRAIPPEELAQAAHGTPSEEVRMRVVKARKRQKLRNQDVHGWRTNAELNQSGLTNWAPLGPSEISHMVNAARILGLTARSWTRVIKVGRTIADLADSDCITVTHLSEALAYRVFERQEVATSRTPFKQPGAY
jgi:magnesium chelatase family protein